MDDAKNSKRNIHGARKQMDSIRIRSTVSQRTVRPVREKPALAKQTSIAREKKTSFLEQADISAMAPKDSRIIQTSTFAKDIFPRHLSFLKRKSVTLFCSGLSVIFIAVFLLSTVFSRAAVTVKPIVESLEIQDTRISLNASVSEVNAAARTIPAELLSFDGSAREDFDASGNDATGQKAIGRARIYNAFETSPQLLVATTRLITDSGILFRLTKSLTIPGAKKSGDGTLTPAFIEADLVADKTGEGSNIDKETRLRIPGFQGSPKYEGFYAIAEKGFSGGGVGQHHVITRDDLAKAQEKISKKVFDDLRQNMVQKIPANFMFADSLSEIEIAAINAPKENTRTDRFTVEVKAVARVFVFRAADLFKLLNQILLKEGDAKMLMDASANFHYQIKNADYDKKIADVSMSGSIKTKKIIASQGIANLVAGKKESAASDDLKQRKDIGAFRISFFPPWILSAPKDLGHINVIVEDPAADMK